MAQIDDLPPLREVIARHDLGARKSLGQNFLLDLNLTSRIARSSGPLEQADVLEIGPGPGGLTRALLAGGVRKVVAIEMDPRCMAALGEIAEHYNGRLDVIEGDALALDHAALFSGRRARIVANLPYNVATPLLIGWLKADPWPPWWESITVLVQREVAERLVATPAERKDYGRLSVLTALKAEARILFDIPPTAFVPQPKVMSSVVHLIPRTDALPCPLSAVETVTQEAFGQRRKMLRQSLKALGDVATLLDQAGIDGTRRAEEIDPDGYVRLAAAMVQGRTGSASQGQH